jgi:hypothetical protein
MAWRDDQLLDDHLMEVIVTDKVLQFKFNAGPPIYFLYITQVMINALHQGKGM